jgi:hypothetical protein
MVIGAGNDDACLTLAGSAVVKGNMELPIKPDLTGWAAVGDCKIALDTKNPLSKALPNVVRVTVPANSKGECGISNSGAHYQTNIPGADMSTRLVGH